MNNTERYFKKPKELLKILNENGALPKRVIAEKMNLSITSISHLIEEFNKEEEAIKRITITHNNVLYRTDKKDISECKSYIKTLEIMEIAINCPKDFFNMNEIQLSELLKVDRKIIQKVKTLIRTEAIEANKKATI